MLRQSATLVALAVVLVSAPFSSGTTLLTGQIEDGESQKIEMPRLPGTWVRNVAWMAPEGKLVEEGELIVTLDPGDLNSQEETYDIEREERRQQAEAELTDNAVAIIDAKIALYRAESAMKMAEIDAAIPVEAITGLIWEQNQLNLVNTKNALRQAKDHLANLEKLREELVPVQEMMFERTEANYQRIAIALEETNIYANKSGLMIYGENPMSGEKIFPGESLPPSTILAMVANQSSLVFRFWVHEADILKIKEDTKLRVTADALPSFVIDSRVTWMSKQAATRENWSDGGYFEVTAEPVETLPNGFVPGMSVMATIQEE